MNKSKICFFEVEEWEKESLKKALPRESLLLCPDPLEEGTVQDFLSCEILSSFVFSPLNKKILKQMPQLRMIATRSTGFDHIDLDYCKQHRIHVANVPVYGERTVAEHAFALILALSKNLVSSIEHTRQGNFSLQGLRGEDLQNKTLGVIGVGNIGKQIIQIAQAFQMKILCHDLVQDKTLETQYSCQFVELNEVLKNSDILTLHVPAHSSTYHLINRSHLPLFKKGMILINTSRGSVIETQCLLEGLNQNIFKGLGLDVLEHEALFRNKNERDLPLNSEELSIWNANKLLLNDPRVLITPHNAFNTHQALERILQTTLENIKAFQKGTLLNSVIE